MLIPRLRHFVFSALSFALLAIAGALVPSVVSAAQSATETAGPVKLQVRATHGMVHVSGSEPGVEIDVRVDQLKNVRERPVRIALVLDRSGSMSGTKIVQAREAAHKLVDLLRPEDGLTVITFDGLAEKLAYANGSETGKQSLHAAIETVSERGGTNIGAGLDLARAELARSDSPGGRIVLVTDGNPSEGLMTPEQLAGRAAQIRNDGFTVTSIGIGTDYNLALMNQVAEAGGGFSGFLQDGGRLAEVLSLEMNQARHAVASKMTLTLIPAPGVTIVEVPGRTITRDGNRVKMTISDLGAGGDAQVYATVRTPEGGTRRLVDARVDFVVGDQQFNAQAGVGVEVSSSSRDVEASKNKEVLAHVHRAVGSVRMVLAAQAFERGDSRTAYLELDNVRRVFGQSADALAGDAQILDETSRRWKDIEQRGRNVYDVRNESSALTKKNMKNFGQNNSY